MFNWKTFILILLFPVICFGQDFVINSFGSFSGSSGTSYENISSDFTCVENGGASTCNSIDGTYGELSTSSTTASWDDLTRKEVSYIYQDYGANHFSGDFEHQFEIQYSDDTSSPVSVFWMLANAIGDMKALNDGAEDYLKLDMYNGTLRLVTVAGGSDSDSDTWAATTGVTYYITLSRDDDGGVNSTGQLTAVVRTGSHSGSTQTTLSADCDAGEQNDYRYLYVANTYKDNQDGHSVDGFCQNLDIGE